MGLRLAAGLGLGAVIGMERQWRARGAGLRTNALVATCAALFVLLSAYGFDAGVVGGVRVADPTRVAAQIVSGIGFLGAGVILRDGLNVRRGPHPRSARPSHQRHQVPTPRHPQLEHRR